MPPARYSSRTVAELALLLLAAIWGSTFYFSQRAMEATSPIFLLFCRFGLAALIVAAFSFPRWKKAPGIRWDHACILGILIGATLSLQNIGLQTLTAGRGAFIAYVYAIFVPPLQLLIVKKPLRLSSLIGLFLTLIGVFFMMSPQAGGFRPGDFVTVLSSMVFAFYIIFIDKFGKTKNFWLFVTVKFSAAALWCGMLALFFEPIQFRLYWPGIFSILYLASFGTACALSIQVRFQHRTSPTRATVILSLEGVFAAVVGYLFGRQLINLQEIIGAGIIIVGVLVSELLPSKKRPSGRSA